MGRSVPVLGKGNRFPKKWLSGSGNKNTLCLSKIDYLPEIGLLFRNRKPFRFCSEIRKKSLCLCVDLNICDIKTWIINQM